MFLTVAATGVDDVVGAVIVLVVSIAATNISSVFSSNGGVGRQWNLDMTHSG